MTHAFDFNKKFSRELKNEIINKRTNKYIDKFGMKRIDAYKRARSEMMPNKEYEKFAKMAQFICEAFEIPTNTDYITISTNRYGQHSWYIKVPINPGLGYDYIDDEEYYGCGKSFCHSINHELEIRLSDHTTTERSENQLFFFPLMQKPDFSVLLSIIRQDELLTAKEREESLLNDIKRLREEMDDYKKQHDQSVMRKMSAKILFIKNRLREENNPLIEKIESPLMPFNVNMKENWESNI